MVNNENLLKGKNTQFSSLNGEETARDAGIESGKVRREKKTMEAIGQAMMSGKPNEIDINDILKDFPYLEKDKAELVTNKAFMLAKLFKKALTGDVRAFEAIRDTIGEKPVDKQKIQHSGNEKPLTKEDIESVKEALKT